MTGESVVVKISSKGQIGIPKKWREELNLNANDLIELSKIDDTIIIKTIKRSVEEAEKKEDFSLTLSLFDILKDFPASKIDELLKELRMEEEERLERFTREFNNRH